MVLLIIAIIAIGLLIGLYYYTCVLDEKSDTKVVGDSIIKIIGYIILAILIGFTIAGGFYVYVNVSCGR
jgi:uncharacterized membrane protein AbrB (regulator of aidB expression)